VRLHKKDKMNMVVNTCNPRYLGGRGKRIVGKANPRKKLEDSI
jgi:hypothetical protein